VAQALETILDAWRPTCSFSIHVTRGGGSPSVGWGPRGYFIEFPAETLSAFFDRGAPTDEARALLAHELAHVIHRDAAPLAFATAYCVVGMLAWPVSGILLGCSPIAPWRSLVPPTNPLSWALTSAVAITAFTVLLCAAQRKIELLADARAALQLGTLTPVRDTVKRLLSIDEENAALKVLLPGRLLSLRATNKSTRAPRGLLRRAIGLLDTHESLERRFERLHTSMHVLNAPDAPTLFAVGALS
jgi:Zn-dependent protease with chaperone function